MADCVLASASESLEIHLIHESLDLLGGTEHVLQEAVVTQHRSASRNR